MNNPQPLLGGVAQNLQYGESDSPNLASKASGAKAKGKGSSTGKKKGPSDESRQKRRDIERNATKTNRVWQVVKKAKIMDELELADYNAYLVNEKGEKYMLSTLTDLRVELLHPFQDKRGDWSSLWEHGPLDKEQTLPRHFLDTAWTLPRH